MDRSVYALGSTILLVILVGVGLFGVKNVENKVPQVPTVIEEKLIIEPDTNRPGVYANLSTKLVKVDESTVVELSDEEYSAMVEEVTRVQEDMYEEAFQPAYWGLGIFLLGMLVFAIELVRDN
jgi:hypothetical protein